MMNQFAPILLLLLQVVPLNGWVTTSHTTSGRTLSSSAIIPGVTIAAPASTTTSLAMAGFGAGDDKSKKKKETKLKPKQQWDRFSDLKKEDKIRVAVKVVDSDASDWLEVGFVRSAENAFTDFAVARQRVLIIEVSWCYVWICVQLVMCTQYSIVVCVYNMKACPFFDCSNNITNPSTFHQQSINVFPIISTPVVYFP
jgi:hypothetical protein